MVDRHIDKIDRMHEEALRELPMLPDSLVARSYEYQQVRKVMKNRGILSYVSGFWMGYTIAMRLKE